MAGKVVVKVCEGEAAAPEFVFENRFLCTVGRSQDCFLRVTTPDTSRRHCLLDIDPPFIRVLDLGSRNGTYINGHKLEPEKHDPDLDLPEFDLHAGDQLRLGSTVLEIETADEPALV